MTATRFPVPLPRAPDTSAGSQVDDYHGTVIPDPYRWLEDPDSPETQAWVAAQNAVTFDYLQRLPDREPLRARLTELIDYERYSAPFKKGGRYFFFKNDGLQNQSVLYVQPSLEAAPRVLLDPNQLSADGTVALTVTEPSRDGTLLLYGISASGSDWQEFKIRQVEDGADRPDHLRWIKFSTGTWTKDGKGFFYARYPEPEPGEALVAQNRGMELYYHTVGTPQSDDRLIYRRPDQPEWGFAPYVTHDGRYLIIGVWRGTDPRTGLFYLDLVEPEAPVLTGPVVSLFSDFDAAYDFIGNDGTVFYLRTDRDAPRSRLLELDLGTPTEWRTIIPEQPEVLETAGLIGGRLVTLYMQDAQSRLRIWERDGRPVTEVPLPTAGSVAGVSGTPDDPEMFYIFTSFLHPATVFRYDVTTGENSVFKAPQVRFDPSRFVTRQVFYPAKDGVKVPMFITHAKDLVLDGQNPTLLYGYGGFNANLTPAFSAIRLAWLERGGVYAVANLRGGGEYGEDWHRAGMLEKKQTVFDDFIAAAEYLIREKYTRPESLAIQGGSNGGLLVGAVMTQRPDLFAVALPAVGVMDMLRFHHFTIGWAWVPEYGSAADPTQFPYLRAYSPLHNLVSGTDYPATLITTADHDDRVVPAHSFKFAAALQRATSWRRPAYIRIDTKAGHGAGKPIAKIIEEEADVMAFALANLAPRSDRT